MADATRPMINRSRYCCAAIRYWHLCDSLQRRTGLPLSRAEALQGRLALQEALLALPSDPALQAPETCQYLRDMASCQHEHCLQQIGWRELSGTAALGMCIS